MNLIPSTAQTSQKFNHYDQTKFNPDKDQSSQSIQFAMLNPQFIMNGSGAEKTWKQWTGDHIQAGLGTAIQSLVAGIVVNLAQVLIQTATDKLRGDTVRDKAPRDHVKDEKLDLEYQSLKVATIIAECETLLDSAGKEKEAVLKMLNKIQKEEPHNYDVYLANVGKCRLERKEQKTP